MVLDAPLSRFLYALASADEFNGRQEAAKPAAPMFKTGFKGFLRPVTNPVPHCQSRRNFRRTAGRPMPVRPEWTAPAEHAIVNVRDRHGPHPRLDAQRNARMNPTNKTRQRASAAGFWAYS